MVGAQFLVGWFVLLIVAIFALCISLAEYLLFAFGLYRMAKNLGLPSPWMAFVPILSSYLLGLIAEKDSMGKRTLKYSWILIISQVVTSAFAIVYYFVIIASHVLGSVGFLAIFILIYGALNIAACVLYYIALYRVYKIFDADNAPIFIILSIFFTISVPILVFVLRNRQPLISYGTPFQQTNYRE